MASNTPLDRETLQAVRDEMLKWWGDSRITAADRWWGFGDWLWEQIAATPAALPRETRQDGARETLVDRLKWQSGIWQPTPKTQSLLSAVLLEAATEITRLRYALAQAEQVSAQDDARLRAAELRVWGDVTYGCDGPDQLADAVLAARAALRQAEAERDDARREAAAPPRVETETPRFRAAVTADYQAGYAKGSEDCRRAAKGRAIIQKAIDRHHQRTSPAPTPRVETETVPDYPAVFDELFGSDPALASPEPAQDGARDTLAQDSATQPLEAAGGEAGQGGRPRPDPASPHVAEPAQDGARETVDRILTQVFCAGQMDSQATAQEKRKIGAGGPLRAISRRVYAEAEAEITRLQSALAQAEQELSLTLSERDKAEAERDDARREAAALLARINGAL